MNKSLNELLEQEKTVSLGKKRIAIPKVPVSRALEVAGKQDYVNNMIEKELQIRCAKDENFAKMKRENQITTALNEYKFAKVYFNAYIDLVLFVIRPKTFIARFFSWIKGNSVSRKWILNNLDVEELTDFLQKVIGKVLNLKKK